jgi:hypothetical protein
MAEMMGSATVRLHFPRQLMSWIETILFMCSSVITIRIHMSESVCMATVNSNLYFIFFYNRL